MTAGIPVMIHLDGETFRRLERAARRRGTTMRELIEHHAQLVAGTRTNHVGTVRAADDDMVDQWVIAARLGVTNQQIAARWHVSKSLVSLRLRERGIIRRNSTPKGTS